MSYIISIQSLQLVVQSTWGGISMGSLHIVELCRSCINGSIQIGCMERICESKKVYKAENRKLQWTCWKRFMYVK